MTVRGRRPIRAAYREAEVAEDYLERRFQHPLGALLHARQASTLARRLGPARPRRVLEIAPGPARLTPELAKVAAAGVVLDASLEMLTRARRRLAEAGAAGWRCVQGDAFELPFAAGFDAVVSFRLIRHFEAGDRRRLYAEIARVLAPGGLLAFDAVSERASAPLRAAAPEDYTVYDALFTPEGLRAELREAGFEAVELDGVQRRYPLLRRVQVLVGPRSRPLARAAMEAIDRLPGGEPLEWVVTCRRA